MCKGSKMCTACSMRNMNGMGSVDAQLLNPKQFKNATGEVAPIQSTGITVTPPKVTLPTVDIKATTTTSTTTKSKTNVWDTVNGVLGLFGNSNSNSAPASTVVYTEEPKTGVPMAVWIVVALLVVLLAVFFIVKSQKS